MRARVHADGGRILLWRRGEDDVLGCVPLLLLPDAQWLTKRYARPEPFGQVIATLRNSAQGLALVAVGGAPDEGGAWAGGKRLLGRSNASMSACMSAWIRAVRLTSKCVQHYSSTAPSLQDTHPPDINVLRALQLPARNLGLWQRFEAVCRALQPNLGPAAEWARTQGIASGAKVPHNGARRLASVHLIAAFCDHGWCGRALLPSEGVLSCFAHFDSCACCWELRQCRRRQKVGRS